MSRYYRRYRRSYNSGYERAKEHIAQRRVLSDRLQGVDKDVEKYFLSLDWDRLEPILDEYEGLYGKPARRYAEETMRRWREGYRKMSGQTATRLFELVPRYMPHAKKFDLFEKLWNKFSPRSSYTIYFGRLCKPADIRAMAQAHLDKVVNGHAVPDHLRDQFRWLAADDTTICEKMLNHFRLREKNAIVVALDSEMQVVTSQLANPSSLLASFHRQIKVGNHAVDISFDPRSNSEQPTETISRSVSSSYEGIGCLVAIVIAVIVIGLVIAANANSSGRSHTSYRYRGR